MDTALATAAWQTFTQEYWQVEPVRLAYAPKGPNGPTLEMIAYGDWKGRLMLPPYQPHLPVGFKPTATEAPYRIERQWLQIAGLLVEDMLARGIRGEVTLPPTVTDPRPWLWAWFRVSPRFTNFLDLPFDLGQADRVVRQQINKAVREKFVCRQTANLDDALACLAASERRKGFDYGITLAGLELAERLLGREALRVYVAYALSGEPASARVVLHRPGGRACDWLAGTADKYLHAGATQMLLAHVLDDLAQAGAAGYNSCGASLETVAHTKAMWGGRLVTQYSLEAYDFRPMKHLLGKMLRYWKRQAAVRKRRANGGSIR